MMQVWTMDSGHTFWTTSGRPFSPSHTTKKTSVTPRFFMSMSTLIQNLAPSPPVPAHSPRTSLRPSTVTPIAAYTGRFATWPSRTLTTMASMNTATYTLSSGRDDHSDISSTTLSVIRDTVSLETDAP